MGKLVSGITDAVGLTSIGDTKYNSRVLADQTRAASQLGAGFQPMKVFGMTGRLGSVTPTYENIGGVDVLSNLDYSIAPGLADIQEGLFGYLPDSLRAAILAQQQTAPLSEGAATVANLAQGYLGESPAQVRQRYIDEQMSLLEPIRAREEQRLAGTAFGRGRTGLNIGDIGNPDLYNLTQGRALQDLALAAQADEAAQRRAAFGTGLLGDAGALVGQGYGLQASAFDPLKTGLGLLTATEQVGKIPLETQLNIAERILPGTQKAGSMLAGGQTAAAEAIFQGQQAANSQMNELMSNLLSSGMKMYGGDLFSGMGGGAGGGGYMGGISPGMSRPSSSSIYSIY